MKISLSFLYLPNVWGRDTEIKEQKSFKSFVRTLCWLASTKLPDIV